MMFGRNMPEMYCQAGAPPKAANNRGLLLAHGLNGYRLICALLLQHLRVSHPNKGTSIIRRTVPAPNANKKPPTQLTPGEDFLITVADCLIDYITEISKPS
jgi:hypothetical protein